MTTLPQDVRDAVVRCVYAECDRLEWETLSPPRKTATYSRWVDEPQIGGALQRYMSRSDARVWLKDGPVHEYHRAINGVGRYVRFTTRRVADPAFLIRNALGPEWRLLESSIRQKPLRCVATHPETGAEREIIWGPLGHLKSLSWAAISSRVEDARARPVIVIVRSPGQILEPSQKREAEAVGAVIGVDVAFVAQPPKSNTEVAAVRDSAGPTILQRARHGDLNPNNGAGWGR